MIRSTLLASSPERTFESLYARHVNDVYRYSLALLDRQTDAEDATQTTFMNAYRALQQGERPREPQKWLRAIAHNVCREHYRRAHRRPTEVALDEDPGELVLDPPTPAIGDVVRGLACLPFNQRAALVMREFEGRSLAEIAAALELSVSAVETLLFRARRALREQLEDQLSCNEAEQAISRQLDGALPRSERGPLRAHLRSCPDCATLARRLRAQRSAVRSLALLPLPASLKLGKLAGGGAASATAGAAGQALLPAGGSLFGALSSSVAAKIAVAAVVGATAVGAGYASLHQRAAGRNGGLRASAPAGPSFAGAVDRAGPGPAAAAAAAARVRPGTTSARAARAAGGSSLAAAAKPARGARDHGSAGAVSSRPAAHRTAATAQPVASGHGGAGAVAHGHGATHSGSGHAYGHSGSGHAYGHTGAGAAKRAPSGHSYGRIKARGTKPAPAATHPAKPAPAAAQPPGQASAPGQLRKLGAGAVSHGQGQSQ